MLRTILTAILMTAPLLVTAGSAVAVESSRNEINADQLRSWYEQEVDMIVVDARTKAYFDGTLLPQAQWLPARSSVELIQSIIPSKDDLVVVYCLGVTCPASGLLYDQLVSLGYKNVYEYHEGLQDWLQRGYPVSRVKLDQ